MGFSTWHGCSLLSLGEPYIKLVAENSVNGDNYVGNSISIYEFGYAGILSVNYNVKINVDYLFFSFVVIYILLTYNLVS